MNAKHSSRAETPHELYGTLLAFTLATVMEQWTGSGVGLILTDLTGTLSASADEASWAVTLYSTAFAVAIALSHRLTSFFGNRRYLALSAVVYAMASAGCAVSPSLAIFLGFRLIQGFAGGCFLARTLVFLTLRLAPKDRVLPLTGYGISFFLIGRFLAPILSGWFADNWSWRWMFAVPVPFMLLAAWLFHRFAAHHWRDDVETDPPDLAGIALLLLGISTLQTVLSRGEIDDWFGSSWILVLAVVTVAAHLAFAVWQFAPWNKHPLLHLRFLRNRGLFSAAVLGTVLGMLLAGSLYVIPQYLRRVESHSALQTGSILALGGLSASVVLALNPVLIKLIGKVGGKAVIFAALATEMVSMGLFGNCVTSDTPDRDLWLPILLNGVFVALSVPTLGLAAFAKMEPREASSARAIYYGCRQLGATLGVTLAVVLIDRRSTLHSARLLDSLFNRNLASIGASIDVGNALAVKRLGALVFRESMVLTFADVFYAMAALSAVMMLLIPLLPTLSSPSQRVSATAEPGKDLVPHATISQVTP
jgi:DHA2 family multidrug resistance protein